MIFIDNYNNNNTHKRYQGLIRNRNKKKLKLIFIKN